MTIPEPSEVLWLVVKPFSGWPRTDEEVANGLAWGWSTGADHFATAGKVDASPLSATWPDTAGTAFKSRVQQAVDATKKTATGMAGLALHAKRLADEVTAAKTAIRSVISAHDEVFRTTFMLGPLASPIQALVVGRTVSQVRKILSDTAARVGAPENLPDAPAPPPPDPGAGPFGSTDLSRPELDLLKAVYYDPLIAMASFVIPDGAEAFAHYFDKTGTPLTVNPDDIAGDVPALAENMRTQLDDQLKAVVRDAAATGNYNTPIPFTSEWQKHNITPGESLNWHIAIGEVKHSVTGTATVLPPAHPDDAPEVQVTYQNHVYDRYNWDVSDPNKQAAPAGIPIPGSKDALLGQYQQSGRAREFDTVGTSTPRTETRKVP